MKRTSSYGKSFTLSFETQKSSKDLKELWGGFIADPEDQHDFVISRIMDAVDQERIGPFTTFARTPMIVMDLFQIPMEVTSLRDFTEKEFYKAIEVLEKVIQKEVKMIRDTVEIGAWLFLPRNVPVIIED